MNHYSGTGLIIDWLNQKGFGGFERKVLDLENLVLTELGAHDFAKTVSHIYYLAKQENNQAVMDFCKSIEDMHREINRDKNNILEDANRQYKALEQLSELTGADLKTKQDVEQFNKQMFERLELAKKLPAIVKEPNLAVLMNGHTAEKLSVQLAGELHRAGLVDLAEKADKLTEAFEDVGKFLFLSGSDKKIEAHSKAMLKKYGHNIPSVIKPNNMILTLQHGNEDKALLGNKGANLVTLHKLGCPVPETIFITSESVKTIHSTQSFDMCSFVQNMVTGMFKTEKVAVRSSGVISMAGMMDTILDVDSTDTEALTKAVLEVVNSWDSERARQYREICHIPHEIQMAVLIQPVIRGDKGYSGICFSRNVNTGSNTLMGEYVKRSLGNNLADGKVTPVSFVDMRTMTEHRLKPVIAELNEIAIKLEKHFKQVQDIEWVYDNEKLYVVQARTAKLSPKAAVKTLLDFYNFSIIDKAEFKKRFNPNWFAHCEDIKISSYNTLIFVAQPAVNGVVTGNVVFDMVGAEKYDKGILITELTTTNDFALMQKVSGVITKIGGFTSHPAVTCRELNKPCITGFEYLDIKDGSVFISGTIGMQGDELKEGDVITMIGNTGEVFRGEQKTRSEIRYEKEVTEILNS